MALDTLRVQQDAVGADRARHRHRHHVDRRHDVAHPRLRPVAAEHRCGRSGRRRSSSPSSARSASRPARRSSSWRGGPTSRCRMPRRSRGSSPSAAHGRHLARRRRASRRMERVFYRGERTKPVSIMGTTRAVRRGELREARSPAASSPTAKCSGARRWRSSATARTKSLFERKGIDPIGKKVRIGAVEYTVIGVIGKRPGIGGFNVGGRLRHHSLHGIPQAVRVRDAPRAADRSAAARAR